MGRCAGSWTRPAWWPTSKPASPPTTTASCSRSRSASSSRRRSGEARRSLGGRSSTSSRSSRSARRPSSPSISKTRSAPGIPPPSASSGSQRQRRSGGASTSWWRTTTRSAPRPSPTATGPAGNESTSSPVALARTGRSWTWRSSPCLCSWTASWSFEYRLLARDGRTVWIRDDAVVVRDERGEPLYTQGFMLDITDRKRAEEALRRSEEEVRRQKQYYETLLELSPAAVVTMDLEERVTSWNPAAEVLFGYTCDEAVGELIDELVLRREDLVEQGQAVTRKAAEQGAAHLIAPRMRKDGTLVEVEVLMAPLVVGADQVGWIVIYHDISELQHQKQFFESLLDISPVATVIIDLEDKISSWNPAAERLFGYSKTEAIGGNIDELIAGSEDLHAEAVGYGEAAHRRPVRAITRRSRKDGTLVDVVLLATPVIVEDEPIGHLAVYHDISELQHAREEAEAATHAKSVFLAIMSHEIRTPMNAVIEMTELLIDTALEREKRGYVEVIHTSGDALLRVIDDVLDFSKIESGKLEGERP